MKTKLINKDIRNNYTNELLIERGLSPEELDYFLNVPDDSYLEDPTLLDNIAQAAEWFEEMTTLSNLETIIVLTDSDVDGFTSAAIFIQYLHKWNPNVHIEPILHKGKGHGLADTINDINELEIAGFGNIPFVILPDAGK